MKNYLIQIAFSAYVCMRYTGDEPACASRLNHGRCPHGFLYYVIFDLLIFCSLIFILHFVITNRIVRTTIYLLLIKTFPVAKY